MKRYNDLINKLNFALIKRTKFFVCKNSKINIALLKLLLANGLILNFYNLQHFHNNICVFLKYWQRKPLMSKIKVIQKNIFLKSKQIKGDKQSNIFFIVSISTGGFLLISNEKFFTNLNFYMQC